MSILEVAKETKALAEKDGVDETFELSNNAPTLADAVIELVEIAQILDRAFEKISNSAETNLKLSDDIGWTSGPLNSMHNELEIIRGALITPARERLTKLGVMEKAL